MVVVNEYLDFRKWEEDYRFLVEQAGRKIRTGHRVNGSIRFTDDETTSDDDGSVGEIDKFEKSSTGWLVNSKPFTWRLKRYLIKPPKKFLVSIGFGRSASSAPGHELIARNGCKR